MTIDQDPDPIQAGGFDADPDAPKYTHIQAVYRETVTTIPGLDPHQQLRMWAIDRAMAMSTRGFTEHSMSEIAQVAEEAYAYVKDATIPPAPPEKAK